MIPAKYSLLALVLVVALLSCTHKHKAIIEITPDGCDNASIRYSKYIQPIFSAHCYACHSTANTISGGLDLEDTTSLKNYLRLSFRGDGMYGSKLYHCLLHSQFALPMPPTYIIDSCSLKKIHYWLALGAPIQ